jgi:hypothetical protein
MAARHGLGSSRRVHAVLSIATLLAIVAYPVLTKIASIAAHGHP